MTMQIIYITIMTSITLWRFMHRSSNHISGRVIQGLLSVCSRLRVTGVLAARLPTTCVTGLISITVIQISQNTCARIFFGILILVFAINLPGSAVVTSYDIMIVVYDLMRKLITINDLYY